jgi:hypothetical membrane protein
VVAYVSVRRNRIRPVERSPESIVPTLAALSGLLVGLIGWFNEGETPADSAALAGVRSRSAFRRADLLFAIALAGLVFVSFIVLAAIGVDLTAGSAVLAVVVGSGVIGVREVVTGRKRRALARANSPAPTQSAR